MDEVASADEAHSAAQPLASTAAEGMADHLSDFLEPLRLLATFSRHARQASTEDLAFTDGIAATPTPLGSSSAKDGP